MILWAPRLDYRTRHERKCRGSAAANTTCSKCGEQGWPIDEGGLSRALGIHEMWCKGPGTYTEEELAERRQEREAAARAKAKAKPKAKGKAKAKAAPASSTAGRRKARKAKRKKKAADTAAREGMSEAQKKALMKKATVLRRPAAYGERALKYVNQSRA